MNKVYVVGIGPGGAQQITPQARAAMDQAAVLCGYTVYIDLVRSLYPGKEVFTTPMTREWERCRRCLELEGRGTPQPYEKVLEEIQERDWNDTHRSIAPLRQAEDAVLLDTTDLDFQESREALLAILRERTNGA